MWMERIAWGWLAVPASAFVALVIVHDQVDKRRRKALRAADFYGRGLDRIDGQWAGKGEAGDRYLDESHPYAADLDLFGAGSLFERLCTARTRAGEDTLADWLRNPADPAEVLGRQGAVAELRPRLDLREQMALMGDDVRAGIDASAMAAWAGAPRLLSSRAAEVAAHVLGTLGVALLAAWMFGFAPAGPFLVAAIVEVAFSWPMGARVRKVSATVDRAGHDLAILAELLRRIEEEEFRSPRLVAIRARLGSDSKPASGRIAHLGRLIAWLEMRKNPAFAPIAAAMLWSTRLAFAIERWRARNGPEVADWLAAVGEFEALCALASSAFENPDDVAPELADGPAPRIEAEGLGHPLLPPDRCVRNDIRLGGDAPRLILISGSNMSGKSTMLRTLGINVVLAQAGASVRAASFRLSPMMPGGTLRVHDSLQAGKSRFYAEIARIRQLTGMAASGPIPLLFLLDELLHGTNSHDRRIGAEAVLRKLLDLGAIGLATTHDLALTEFAEGRGPAAVNAHFQDDFDSGEMHFDYRMRPGVVGHSNALALMRSVGIDV
ncbi:MAG: DNA mismatch repair protein MutS [Isosphaeraceae bacterium]